MSGNDIDEEDMNSIIHKPTTEVDFIGIEDDKEPLYLVAMEIEERYELNKMNEEDIVNIYLEIKNRCGVSNTKIADFMGIHISKLRRILKKRELL